MVDSLKDTTATWVTMPNLIAVGRERMEIHRKTVVLAPSFQCHSRSSEPTQIDRILLTSLLITTNVRSIANILYSFQDIAIELLAEYCDFPPLNLYLTSRNGGGGLLLELCNTERARET